MTTSAQCIAIGEPSDLDDAERSRQLLSEVLSVIRQHLGMEVAFVSRVVGGRGTVEQVDAEPWFRPISVGDPDDEDQTYCARVLNGEAPQLIIDAMREPSVADIEATWKFPIGSYLSVPIQNPAGGSFGTLCCFSRAVKPDLQDRDIEVLRVFAEIVSKHLQLLEDQYRSRQRARHAINAILEDGGPVMALQPVVDLAVNEVCGYEALARFPSEFGWTPDRWFQNAELVGLGPALEAAALLAALEYLPRLTPDMSLTINVSATALLASPTIATRIIAAARGTRLIVELTEHDRLQQPELLEETLTNLRSAAVRIAVDDAGAGYAGLDRILTIAPEVLKLDRSLIHGIAEHLGRQAMCEAMVRFARRTNTLLIAEGVETEADLDAIRALGVRHAQGFLLGRPVIPSPDTPPNTAQPRRHRHSGSAGHRRAEL